MTYETAVEVESMLVPLEAALDTLDVINGHFCDKKSPLLSARVLQLGNALWTVEQVLTTLIESYRNQVDAAFEARKKEGEQA